MDAKDVKDSRMFSLLILYDMHTDYFNRALVDIPDDEAQNRLGTKANHIAWIAGSLVQVRYEMAALFGKQLHQTNHALFDGFKGIQDDLTYPPLAEFKADWDKISPVLRAIYTDLSAAKLDSKFDMHGMTMTHYEMVTFQTYREANCIGQIALWRRLLGFPGLKYDDN